jgi:hypothetical protein
MLAWAGFSYLYEGIGLHPLIAFPTAIGIYGGSWMWIAADAEAANCAIEDYLEELDTTAEMIHDHYHPLDDPAVLTARQGLMNYLNRRAHEVLE